MRRPVRLLVLPVALAALAPALVCPAVPAQAATTSRAAAGTFCDRFDYVGHHRVATFHAAPVVTHALQVGVGAHTHVSITKGVTFRNEVTAGTKYSGGASGSVDWLWGSVSAHFGVTVAKSHKHTSTRSTTVKKAATNNSDRNRIYVAYRGVTRYTGRWYQTYCKGVAPGSRSGTIKKHWGTYITYVGGGDGLLYCKGGSSSALGRAAIKGFCR